jgi:hypothetical protein
MADRVLTWTVDGGISRTKVEVDGKRKLDADYRPIRVNVMVRVAGIGDNLVIDIKDDGVSIFNSKPALSGGHTDKTWTTIPATALRKDSIITCDIDQINSQQGGRDLAVELELEKI